MIFNLGLYAMLLDPPALIPVCAEIAIQMMIMIYQGVRAYPVGAINIYSLNIKWILYLTILALT